MFVIVAMALIQPDVISEQTQYKYCARNSLYVYARLNGHSPNTLEAIDAHLGMEGGVVSLEGLCAAGNSIGMRLAPMHAEALPSIFPHIAHFSAKGPGQDGHFVVVVSKNADDTITFVDGTFLSLFTISRADYQLRWSGYYVVQHGDETEAVRLTARHIMCVLGAAAFTYCVVSVLRRLGMRGWASSSIVFLVCACTAASGQESWRGKGAAGANCICFMKCLQDARIGQSDRSIRETWRAVSQLNPKSMGDLCVVATGVGLDFQVTACDGPELLKNTPCIITLDSGTAGSFCVLLGRVEGSDRVEFLRGDRLVRGEMEMDDFLRAWSGYRLAPREPFSDCWMRSALVIIPWIVAFCLLPRRK